jgi:hypothetical protein
MTDYAWPDDLVPYQVSFYLQPHTGGSESPFNRVSKIYGLSAPRWVCSMSFRGGYWGTKGLDAVGPRLDGLIAKLKGRQNRISIYDFRRPEMRSRGWKTGGGSSAAAAGDTSMTISGQNPGVKILAGDYIGGDGRPHIITDDVIVGVGGTAVVNFEPPLSAAVGLNAAVFGNPTGIFRLVSDDAGDNGVEVGNAVSMTLSFVEDL